MNYILFFSSFLSFFLILPNFLELEKRSKILDTIKNHKQLGTENITDFRNVLIICVFQLCLIANSIGHSNAH